MAFEKEFENLFRSFAELRNQQAKTDEQLKRTDEQMKFTDERLSAKLEKLSKELGNIGNNNGAAAEEFFWNGLKNKKEFEGIKIDYTEANVRPPSKKGIQDEFDILMWNGNSVVIVESKYKVHPNLVEQIKEKKIPNFKTLIPDRANHKIYCAIAGFSIPDEVAKSAKEEGFFIIRQSGDNMVIEKGEIKPY